MRHGKRMTKRLLAVAALALSGCGDAPLANTAAPQEAPGHEDVVVRRVVWPNGSATGADARWATPSPDGTLLPYIDWRTGDVGIRDLSTGTSRPLTSTGWEGGEYPGPAVVSPDGQQVAYPWSNRDFFFELRIVGLDGSEPRVVYSNREAQLAWAGLDWSSDGAQILALLQRGDLTYQIALISVATGSARILRSLDWRPPGQMVLSPDGRFVLYDYPPTPESRQRDLYLLSTDATTHTALVADAANDFVLGWVDNQHVLFASDRSGTPGAYLLRVRDARAEREPQLVKSDLWRITPGGATRNGSYYYTVNTASTDIFTTPLDPATGRVLTSPTLIARDGRHPAWSRDGRYLAYVSTSGSPAGRGEPVVVRIRSIDTGETRDLTPRLTMSGAAAAAEVMHWFPDGSALLVRASDLTNRSGLFRVDSQTGAVNLVWATPETIDTRSGYSPALSPDGTTLFFSRGDSKTVQIVAVDLERRTERVVVSTEGFIMAITVSPDGQRLAFEGFAPEDGSESGGSPPHASLYVVPVSGGERVPLHRFEEPHGINMVHGEVEWSADGRYLFFVTTSTEPPFVSRLWRIPSAGGQAERLDQLSDASFDEFSIRLHPNGREVAFSAGSPGGVELWVMENLFALITDPRPTTPSAR